MIRAIEEGHKGFGFVAPNPMVGCVVLNSKHELISSGYHKKFGGAHAEVEALKDLLPEEIEGSHVVVTLEPCAHHGKTPPCAEMIARLPIASLTYGIVDPNPEVSGRGIEIIKKAGVRVRQLESMEMECEQLAEVFLYNTRNKMPFVALKMGSSLDGVIALRTGESKWLTSELSRDHVHYLRAGYDAVCVGVNTIIVDDPMLNVRHEKFKDKPNKVIVIDPQGQTLEKIKKYKIAQTHQLNDIYVLVEKGFRKETEVHVIECSTFDDGTLDLNEAMRRLYQEDIRSVFVEGGARTYSQFIQQKAFQRLYLYQAPVILGSKNGRSWSEDFHIRSLEEKLKLHHIKTKKLGDDILITARV
jgi:diaminohydroxyphosphoribosylaminopyrimidine deaminase/5-amino-6-(5-phosphoribosylamino)uracil reductase